MSAVDALVASVLAWSAWSAVNRPLTVFVDARVPRS
jgi:hypothetical protein